MRQGCERRPAISGNVVGIKGIYHAGPVEAAGHVDAPIRHRSSHVGQRHWKRRASSPGIARNVVDPGGVADTATAIKAAYVIDLAIEDYRLGEKVLVRRWRKARPGIGCEIETQQIVMDLV